jgi:integrase
VALLVRHRALVDGWPAQAYATVPDDAYVFSPRLDGCKPFRPDNFTSFFVRVRDGLGHQTVRLHDLRHFTATQLIRQGLDVRTVARRLGHSDPSVTQRRDRRARPSGSIDHGTRTGLRDDEGCADTGRAAAAS